MFAVDIGYKSALNHAEAATDREGASLDMSGKEWAVAFVKYGDIASSGTNSIKLQQSSDDGVADAWSDLLGTAITVAADDDNQTFAIAIEKPRKRYIRVYVDKDTSNNTEEMAWYIYGGGHKLPSLASVTDALTVEYHVSPQEGTA